jgi:hypothetical protein
VLDAGLAVGRLLPRFQVLAVIAVRASQDWLAELSEGGRGRGCRRIHDARAEAPCWQATQRGSTTPLKPGSWRRPKIDQQSRVMPT